MRSGGGKGKGNRFESVTAKQLSLWLTSGGDRTQLLWTSQSGGWSIKHEGGDGWRQVGDLAPNGPEGVEFRRRFAVECKHHKNIDLWHLFTAVPGENLLGWWTKLLEECAPYALTPLLVFKMNFRPTMIAGPRALLIECSETIPMILSVGLPGGDGFSVAPLEDFLSIRPERYYECVQKMKTGEKPPG